ncbi:MAG: tRNA (adenosine(37)-N6)-threonylcarbamoyltransferase complex transferase subunit TsaD, partial [Proteobacteria bacterium]|nr:tRNA (adenosine(37)-N6)-threonylcarbamoyltransferase complex transferase subunit TsaD [Pseudomonadota bacterium]
LDFSFSGLKTHAMNAWRNSSQDEQTRADIAAAFEIAVVETFAIKCRRALEMTGLKSLVIAGGVAANEVLRARLQVISEQFNATLFYPRLEYCTDNGAMIAYAGYEKFRLNKYDPKLIVRARWPLIELS